MKDLIASNGMYLTNGDVVVQSVSLPDKADPSVWRQITEDEAALLTNEELPIAEDEATEADYQAALREMGVKV